MGRQNAAQRFAWIFAGLRFLIGQQERRFVRLAVAGISVFRRTPIGSVIFRNVSRSQFVKYAPAAIEISTRGRAASANVAEISKESGLLEKVASLHRRQEEVEAVSVAGAVMAGET